MLHVSQYIVQPWEKKLIAILNDLEKMRQIFWSVFVNMKEKRKKKVERWEPRESLYKYVSYRFVYNL